jgi:hypothetical protein
MREYKLTIKPAIKDQDEDNMMEKDLCIRPLSECVECMECWHEKKSGEEDGLLLDFIRSHSAYKDVKSLSDVSEGDMKIFRNMLKKDVKKYGVEDVERQIRNKMSYYKI